VSQTLQVKLCGWLWAVLAIAPAHSLAWNAPAHMLNGSLTYQILRRVSEQTIESVKTILQKHPWYETRWKPQLDNVSSVDRDELLFMLAPRWADDIRTTDRAKYHHATWHYINFPFQPNGQAETVRITPPEPVNILTALAENERIAKTETNAESRAIALTWLFHLVGDVHQPLHTVQLFTAKYPNGDRGGNEICIRPMPNRKAMNLHEFWDDVITSSMNISRLRNRATALRNSDEFSRRQLTELAASNFESWTKESFEIAVKIAYQNGAFFGTPKETRPNCNEIDAAVLPAGYAKAAGRISDRRIVLAGYRLADVLKRITGE
jgi:hypothetical protein